MNYVRVKSYAKINLTLNLKGVCGGYHMIDSLVASVDIYDTVAVKKRADKLISVTMHGLGSEAIAHADNNAARAGEAFVSAFGTCGADITVYKNIPMGAGLGGSSADVAGVLNAMAKLYGVDDRQVLKRIADSIGSDCGYMLTGGYARITGRGERVEYLDSRLKLDIGLIAPRGGVSTAQCYALSDGLERGADTTEAAVAALMAGDKAELGKLLNNGLTKAAEQLNSGVSECIEKLRAFDPLGVNMTGSGSGVYALFENDSFLRYAMSRYRGQYAFIATKTVVPTKED